MQRMIWLSTGVVLLMSMAAAAGPLPRAEPESVGMSSQRLKRIDRLVQRKIEQGELVGAITMVARDGRLVHFESSGLADAEAARPLKKDAILRFYSMTKAITTVAAMMLYEQGAFQLYDPVHQYVPQLKNMKVFVDDGTRDGARVPPRTPMTIRQLMAHTSGLTYGLFGAGRVDQLYAQAGVIDYGATNQDLIDKLERLPLMFHPGRRWQYGVSTDVLGYLIEGLSGTTLDRFFKTKIFDRLKMPDTAFHVPAEKMERFAVNYRWDESGRRTIEDHPSTTRYQNPATFFSGGGGLVSTAHDYMRFCQMLLNGGELDGVRLVSPKTVALMTMNHLDDAVAPDQGVTPGPGAAFGLGFRIRTDVARSRLIGSVGSYEWGGMASTAYFIDPAEKLIGIILTQKFPTDLRLRDEFKVAVYQAITDSYAD